MIAVKRLAFETHKEQRKAFNEIRILRWCINHPNILQYKRCHIVKRHIWIVTEFLDGGTLAQLAGFNRFTEPQLAYVAYSILSGLEFLHRSQIAHRDIKTSNIMMDVSGVIKLIDLGLASDMSQGSLTSTVGSVRFLIKIFKILLNKYIRKF